MRFLTILLAYLAAFVAFYGATTIAPDMKWPVTDTEFMAAQLLVLGFVAKIVGSVALVTTK